VSKRKPPSDRAKLLGGELRKLRGKWTLIEAGRRTGYSHATIKRYEDGDIAPAPDKLIPLFEGYGIPPDSPRARGLLALARDIQNLAKGAAPPLGRPPSFAALMELELSAVAARIYEATLIPIFAQTEDYARALFALRHTEPEISERVRERMTRQRNVLQERRIPLDLLVSEAALRYVVGGLRVWRGQLNRLLEIADMHQVTMRVLPFIAGEAAAMATSCHLLKYPEEVPTVVYFETRRSRGFVEQPDEVSVWEQDFDDLWDMAWLPSQTREAITAIVSERLR
jgi:transcriptional regulator with XRE-family HTH domain